MKEKEKYEYFAFISYKREDEKWAKWLQKKLESFSLPTALRKQDPSLPGKIRPVFRDQSELSGGNLKAEIEKGLNNSKYLIVICSPRSAKSPWVSKEVCHFIDQSREISIIPFIIGGIPNAATSEDECFPEGLRRLSGEKELLGININEMGREAAVIKVIAQMFNLRFDSLWQRHEKEKKRKRLLVGILSLTIILILLAVSGYIANQNSLLEKANNEIRAERDRANIERDRAELANSRLGIANDSILKGNQRLNVALQDLELSNIHLSKANKDLKAEKDRVSEALLRVTYERIKLQAQNIREDLEDNKVLSSMNQVLKILPNESSDIPLVENALDVLNNGLFQLSRRGYKCIDITPSDTLFTEDGRWCAYNYDGEYFVYDVQTQKSIKLPGEDRIDYSRMFISEDGYLYGMGCEKCFKWNIQTQELLDVFDIEEELYKWLDAHDRYEGFTPKRLTGIRPYSYLHNTLDKIWGHHKIFHFDSFDNDEEIALIATDGTTIDKIIIDKKYKLNSDFNFSPKYPVVSFRENDHSITVFDLLNNSTDYIYTDWDEKDSLINKILCLNTGKEVVVNSKLYSKRKLNQIHPIPVKIYEDSVSMIKDFPQSTKMTKCLNLNGKKWILIDSAAHANLYLEQSDDYPGNCAFGTLLYESNGKYHEFKPYVAYTMGNGLSMMHSAKIVNGNQILIIAAQGPHSIYDPQTLTRRYFSSSNLNSFMSDYAHYQIFLNDAKVIKDGKWLITSSGGGAISIYDINTGCILLETAITSVSTKKGKSEFLGNINFDTYHFSNDGQFVYGCVSEHNKSMYVCFRLPTINEYLNFARSEIQNFWKANQ